MLLALVEIGMVVLLVWFCGLWWWAAWLDGRGGERDR